MATRMAFIALFGLFAASSPKDDANARDLKQLQGKWVGEWLFVNGKKTHFADHKLSVSVVFKGDLVTAESTQEGKSAPKKTGQVTLDANKKPRTMDIVARDADDNGKTVRALYAFEDDTLKLCAALPGHERPAAFKSSTMNGHTLMFFKRSN